MQLRALEEAFGVALFTNSGRNIKLTSSGEVFLINAINVIGEMKNLEASIDELKNLEKGEVELLVVSTAKYFMPYILVQFRKEFPNINIKMRIENRHNTINLLSRNEADLAIMGRIPPEIDCVKSQFATNPMAIIASPEHQLCDQKNLPVSVLKDEVFVVRESGSGTRNAMERYLSNNQIEVKVAMEMPSNESIKQAVMAGMGLSFISLRTIGHEARAGFIKVLDLEGMPIMANWYVAHLRQRRLSPPAAAFERFIIENGARLIEQWA